MMLCQTIDVTNQWKILGILICSIVLCVNIHLKILINRATGSCKGDSGGPLYEKKGKRLVEPDGDCGKDDKEDNEHFDQIKWIMDDD